MSDSHSVIDIYGSCDRSRINSNIWDSEEWEKWNNIHVLNKIPNKVKGLGYECSKVASTIKTYMNFLRGRSIENPIINIIKVNKVKNVNI